MRKARRPRSRARAIGLDLGAVLVTVALLSVPHVLSGEGPAGAGSATEPPDVSAPATVPPDAVPSGPVQPVDDEPLAATRSPFEQLVVPEPPPSEETPAAQEGGAGQPDSADRSPGDMEAVELPEPEEQAAPSEESGVQEEGGALAPSDEPSPSEDEASSARTPPPAAAGPERLHLEAIRVDEAGVTRAHIRLAGKRYEPAEGEGFGDGYRVAEIDGLCVRVVRGDERQRLCDEDRVFPK